MPPNTKVDIPKKILNLFSDLNLDVNKAPRGAPNKAPILRKINRFQSDILFVTKKAKNPAMQIGASAKVVAPIELLPSLPAIKDQCSPSQIIFWE